MEQCCIKSSSDPLASLSWNDRIYKLFYQIKLILCFQLIFTFLLFFSGLNSIQVLGRVGQEPVTRGENDNFVTFSVATSKTYPKKNMQGETGINKILCCTFIL